LNNGYKQDKKNNTATTLCVSGYNLTENAVRRTKKNDEILQSSKLKKKYAVITFATINKGCNEVFKY
jgi:hypothetical protein